MDEIAGATVGARVLVVEDDPEIAALIQATLVREGFEVRLCGEGRGAIAEFREWQPVAIVLDWMLPGLDGLEVCARIRQQMGPVDPFILMLTARGEEFDRIIGLSTGADDYLVKPFSPRELVARIRAMLRRSLRGQTHPAPTSMSNTPPEPIPTYETQHFKIDLDRHEAHQKSKDHTWELLKLTALEFKLLSAFLSYPQRVWTRDQLIDKLWGDDFFGDERVVDTHIARLRKKVESNPSQPQFVTTVVGIGYKFAD